MDFNPSSPIWLQLLDQFKHLIASGFWQPGTKLPSVRDLASQYRVNPNTIQRALSELEREGLCVAERTSGRYATNDVSAIEQLRTHLAQHNARKYCTESIKLNIDQESAIRLLKKVWIEETK